MNGRSALLSLLSEGKKAERLDTASLQNNLHSVLTKAKNYFQIYLSCVALSKFYKLCLSHLVSRVGLKKAVSSPLLKK